MKAAETFTQGSTNAQLKNMKFGKGMKSGTLTHKAKRLDIPKMGENENLYSYYSNIGRQMMAKSTPKVAEVKVSRLKGVFNPHTDMPSTHQLGRARSMVDLKQAGQNVVGTRNVQIGKN